jgi:hypothetical protein
MRQVNCVARTILHRLLASLWTPSAGSVFSAENGETSQRHIECKGVSPKAGNIPAPAATFLPYAIAAPLDDSPNVISETIAFSSMTVEQRTQTVVPVAVSVKVLVPPQLRHSTIAALYN